MTDTPNEVKDLAGWQEGMRAALRWVFGTNTELRLKHGGIKEDIAHAKEKVGAMSQSAEALLYELDGEAKGSVDVELEDLINKI